MTTTGWTTERMTDGDDVTDDGTDGWTEENDGDDGTDNGTDYDGTDDEKDGWTEDEEEEEEEEDDDDDGTDTTGRMDDKYITKHK